jgi:hypothetical protein
LLVLGTGQSAQSAQGPSLGSTPIPNPCAGHLTRAPDSSVTLQANKMLYELKLDIAQAAYKPQLPEQCAPRWVTEIKIPSTASGCATCNNYAEIAAGATVFPNSKKYEEHFYRPTDGAGEKFCKSYTHEVAVYRKANGEANFQLKRNLYYRGHWENGTCHVKATYLGNPSYDTAEVFAPAMIPSSGTDVYRLLQYLAVDGVYRDLNVAITFEKP